ncbi:hypothetical protein [Paenibacillus sp. HW567]|uniref:hypothetical protein n=1 Tax=Paenibacillus sp. HW567 TaxID=1034769 RepID=UPI00035F9E97|nr:hypothetical protein [Paenibacillus sp. HW567]
MKKFTFINFIGIIFAVSIFVHTEIKVNYYRILDMFKYSENEVTVISNLIISAFYIVAFILVGVIIKREFINSKLKYLSSLLWFPYYLILINIFSLMFPLNNPALKPLPVVGLIILFLNLVYPAVIFIFALMFDLIKLFKKS